MDRLLEREREREANWDFSVELGPAQLWISSFRRLLRHANCVAQSHVGNMWIGPLFTLTTSTQEQGNLWVQTILSGVIVRILYNIC